MISFIGIHRLGNAVIRTFANAIKVDLSCAREGRALFMRRRRTRRRTWKLASSRASVTNLAPSLLRARPGPAVAVPAVVAAAAPAAAAPAAAGVDDGADVDDGVRKKAEEYDVFTLVVVSTVASSRRASSASTRTESMSSSNWSRKCCGALRRNAAATARAATGIGWIKDGASSSY